MPSWKDLELELLPALSTQKQSFSLSLYLSPGDHMYSPLTKNSPAKTPSKGNDDVCI